MSREARNKMVRGKKTNTVNGMSITLCMNQFKMEN
jgi:hypothetical protein